MHKKTAQYYDSYGHNTPLYWKLLWYISTYLTHIYLMKECVCSSYFDTRCEAHGHKRTDWENWRYMAMKVSTKRI